MVELAIFDMDGLIIDSEPISKNCWRSALEHHQFEMNDEFFIQLIGRNQATARELMSKYYGPSFDFDKVKAKQDEIKDAYVEKHGMPLKKGLIHMLNRLDELGIKKCVATSTGWDSMQKTLGDLDLLNRYDAFITGDRVKIGKPNPEIFLKAAEMLNASPDKCVVLEDSAAGIAAAYAAGMKAILIPDTIPPTEEVLKQIYAQCGDLIEAAEIIANLHLKS